MNKPAMLLSILALAGGGLALALLGEDRGGWDAVQVPGVEVAQGDSVRAPLWEPIAAGAREDYGEDDGEAPIEAFADLDTEGPLEAREAVAGAKRERRPLVIQVRAGRADGPPLPGVPVFVADLSRPDPRPVTVPEHWSERALRSGERYLTGEDGRVVLPPIEQTVIVTASRPGEYGYRAIHNRHKELETIVLVPDVTVSLVVVDSAGSGVAGVPVVLAQDSPRWSERQARREMEQRQRAARARPSSAQVPTLEALMPIQERVLGRWLSGPEGRVEVRHFQAYRRAPAKWWPAALHYRYRAGLAIPLAVPVAVPFAGEPVSEEEIRLVLPPVGSVRLSVVDRQGRPFVHPFRADLIVESPAAAAWTRAPVRREQGAPGEVLFVHVGVGTRLLPRLSLDDNDFRWQGAAFAGPSRPGDCVVVEVPMPATFGMLCGRIVSATGEPLTGRRLQMLVNARAGRVEGEDLTTDETGHFQLPFKTGKHVPPFTLDVRDGSVQPPLGLWRGLPALADGLVIELGDVVLSTCLEIAAGIVRDDTGKPLAGARVQLQQQRDVGQNVPKLTWRDETYSTVTSDDAGGFALFGHVGAGSYRLRASLRGHFTSNTEPFSPGAQFDLVLVRSSHLRATLLAPAWFPAQQIRTVVEAAGPTGMRREARARGRGGRSAVAFRNLPAGTWNFAVYAGRFPTPVLQIEGIELDPGENGVHPRLTDLDLSPWLHRYEFFAVDQDGLALSNVSSPLLAKIVQPDGKSGFVPFAWQKGRLEVVSASRHLEVVQLAPGYRVRDAVVVPGRNELVFEQLPIVELHLAGLHQLCTGVERMRISMVYRGDTGLPQSLRFRDDRTGRQVSYSRAQLGKSSGAWLTPQDRAAMPLMRPGDHQVVLRLQGARRKTVSIPLGSVKVTFGAGRPEVHAVAFDQERVRAAVARFLQ